MKGTRIIVASGKGGTGKTTVAAALAMALKRGLAEVQFLDCDVEEPDAGIYLKPAIDSSSEVTIEVPVIDAEKCNGCGECQPICQYNAIAMESGSIITYAELCRGCGACKLVCPTHAITENERRIGVIESGTSDNLIFHRGVLDIGQHSTLPLIESLKSMARTDVPTILDSAPGTASPVIPSVKGCDYCILVTEPTPFGLYDLELMVRVIREFGIPAGIIINKDEAWSSNIEKYASENGLPILMRVPLSREIASLCSRGVVLTEADPSWDDRFWTLYEEVERTIWYGRSKSPL